MARHEPKAGVLQQMTMPAAWRKWEQAGQTLNEAEEPEDCQSVGMRCRECLIAMVRTLSLPEMVPEKTEPPKRADVVGWCGLIADHVAHGSIEGDLESRLEPRELADTRAWRKACGWVDRARTDTAHPRPLRNGLRYRQGVPDRCEACGSYQFELWADEPGVPMKPRCRSCGWTKDEAPLADVGQKGTKDDLRRKKRR
jgi:hypothetical protein